MGDVDIVLVLTNLPLSSGDCRNWVFPMSQSTYQLVPVFGRLQELGVSHVSVNLPTCPCPRETVGTGCFPCLSQLTNLSLSSGDCRNWVFPMSQSTYQLVPVLGRLQELSVSHVSVNLPTCPCLRETVGTGWFPCPRP